MNNKTFARLLMCGVLSSLSFNLPADTQGDLDKAEKIHQQAIALEGGWLTTEDYIKEARSFLKANKKSEAQEAAQLALAHAQQSLTQAQQQREHWREPKYIRESR